MKDIPLHSRFPTNRNSLKELEKNETFDQLIKGLILQPSGLVDTSFPNDVSIEKKMFRGRIRNFLYRVEFTFQFFCDFL